MSGRPFPWESTYPPTLRWDLPDPPTSVPALLDAAAARNPDRAAIEFLGRPIPYRELHARAGAAAAGLAALGVGRGVSVGLYLPNTPFHPIAFFATLQVGGRLVHLSPLDPPPRLRFKLEDSETRILVTNDDPALLDRAAKLLEERVIDRLIVAGARDFDPHASAHPLPAGAIPFSRLGGGPPATRASSIDPDALALLQYTGGTTGQPKGAMLTHANLTAAVGAYRAWFAGTGTPMGPGDRVICALPLFHIYALTTILLLGLDRGATLLLRLRFDVETTLRDIEIGRATFFAGVPTMWSAIANHPTIERRDLSSLRVLSSGGAPLPTEIVAAIRRRTGRQLGAGWGMTETAPAGTRMLPDQAYAPGLVGVPLPGVEMQIVALDDPRRVLAAHEIGEIRVRGPNVASGYWRRPAQSAASHVDGFLLTGDVGYQDERGSFYLVDRKDDMIISGGFNVYPTMIEQAIYEHPAVEEALVIGIPDEYRGQSAKAFVKLRAGASPLTLEALREFLNDRLGRHELPAALEIRAALPRTAVGKLWRRGLIAGSAEDTDPSVRTDPQNTSGPNARTPGAPA
jgi:long-chain acyl-CoA synthetase